MGVHDTLYIYIYIFCGAFPRCAAAARHLAGPNGPVRSTAAWSCKPKTAGSKQLLQQRRVRLSLSCLTGPPFGFLFMGDTKRQTEDMKGVYHTNR